MVDAILSHYGKSSFWNLYPLEKSGSESAALTVGIYSVMCLVSPSFMDVQHLVAEMCLHQIIGIWTTWRKIPSALSTFTAFISLFSRPSSNFAVVVGSRSFRHCFSSCFQTKSSQKLSSRQAQFLTSEGTSWGIWQLEFISVSVVHLKMCLELELKGVISEESRRRRKRKSELLIIIIIQFTMISLKKLGSNISLWLMRGIWNAYCSFRDLSGSLHESQWDPET